QGRAHHLSLRDPPRQFAKVAPGEIAEAFHVRHRATYGHDNRAEPVQLVSARVTAIGAMPPLAIRRQPAPAGSDALKGHRRVWFRDAGEASARIYQRARMPAGVVCAGPAVIESLESTIPVPWAWQAVMDDNGFVRLTRR